MSGKFNLSKVNLSGVLLLLTAIFFVGIGFYYRYNKPAPQTKTISSTSAEPKLGVSKPLSGSILIEESHRVQVENEEGVRGFRYLQTCSVSGGGRFQLDSFSEDRVLLVYLPEKGTAGIHWECPEGTKVLKDRVYFEAAKLEQEFRKKIVANMKKI